MMGKGKFEIEGDFETGPDADTGQTKAPSLPRARLGPMAKAIQETGAANSKFAPIAKDAEAKALTMALELKKLRDANLDLRRIPLDEIDEAYLKRDRRDVEREALEELKGSIRAQGLSVPIRVDLLDDGRFGLNQGLRRLIAFRELHEETADEAFALIPALVDRETERDSAYRRMVDENLVREDISHAEMALLAIAYADESGCTEEIAVSQLYESVSKQKRYHIAAFVRVMRSIGDLIKFPRDIGRDFGMSIASKVKDEAGLQEIRDALIGADASSPEAERVALESGLKARRSPKVQAQRPEGVTFRMLVGPKKKRRVDVALKGKRITISGFKPAEVDLDRLRTFIEEMASR